MLLLIVIFIIHINIYLFNFFELNINSELKYIMSCILYYSNYANHKKIIKSISDQNYDDNILCIDNRITGKNNAIYRLENNQRVLLPPTVTKVPHYYYQS